MLSRGGETLFSATLDTARTIALLKHAGAIGIADDDPFSPLTLAASSREKKCGQTHLPLERKNGLSFHICTTCRPVPFDSREVGRPQVSHTEILRPASGVLSLRLKDVVPPWVSDVRAIAGGRTVTLPRPENNVLEAGELRLLDGEHTITLSYLASSHVTGTPRTLKLTVLDEVIDPRAFRVRWSALTRHQAEVVLERAYAGHPLSRGWKKIAGSIESHDTSTRERLEGLLWTTGDVLARVRVRTNATYRLNFNLMSANGLKSAPIELRVTIPKF